MTPAERAEIVLEETQYRSAAEQIKIFRVVDDVTMDRAADWVRQLREVFKVIEAKRTKITRPLLEAKREVDALFDGPKSAIEEAQYHLRREMGAHHARVETERQRVMRESVATLAAGQVPTAIMPAPVDVPKVNVRQVWEPEIVDAGLVPREYCSPDVSKIKDAIWYADTPHKEPHPIPGVKFNLKSITVVR